LIRRRLQGRGPPPLGGVIFVLKKPPDSRRFFYAFKAGAGPFRAKKSPQWPGGFFL
jgi:hypothetical protein